jgi:hypothetical protein
MNLCRKIYLREMRSLRRPTHFIILRLHQPSRYHPSSIFVLDSVGELNSQEPVAEKLDLSYLLVGLRL